MTELVGDGGHLQITGSHLPSAAAVIETLLTDTQIPCLLTHSPSAQANCSWMQNSTPFQMFYLQISGPLSYHIALIIQVQFHISIHRDLTLFNFYVHVMKISHGNNEVFFSIMLQCPLMHSLDQRASCFSPSREESFFVCLLVSSLMTGCTRRATVFISMNVKNSERFTSDVQESTT